MVLIVSGCLPGLKSYSLLINPQPGLYKIILNNLHFLILICSSWYEPKQHPQNAMA
jgi:hypothetical protein